MSNGPIEYRRRLQQQEAPRRSKGRAKVFVVLGVLVCLIGVGLLTTTLVPGLLESRAAPIQIAGLEEADGQRDVAGDVNPSLLEQPDGPVQETAIILLFDDGRFFPDDRERKPADIPAVALNSKPSTGAIGEAPSSSRSVSATRPETGLEEVTVALTHMQPEESMDPIPVDEQGEEGLSTEVLGEEAIHTDEAASGRDGGKPTPKPAAADDDKTGPKRVAAPKSAPAPPAPIQRPARKAAGQPQLVIVIDDLGLNARRTQRTIDLPAPLSLSFLPYSNILPKMTRRGRERGHEVMLHMPMEPMNMARADPGPNALIRGLEPSEFDRRFIWALDRMPGIEGINNHMGSRLTQNRPAMERVMTILKNRNFFFLDSLTTPNSIGWRVARSKGIPYLVRDVFLDHQKSEEFVARQLRQLESIGKERGYAIAVGHPYPETISVLNRWLPDARRRGFGFTTLKELLNPQDRLASAHY